MKGTDGMMSVNLLIATRLLAVVVVSAYLIYAAWQGQVYKRRLADAALKREASQHD